MTLGFSFLGLIYLCLLIIPNLLWTRNKPSDYEHFVLNENKVLLGFERVGQVLVTTLFILDGELRLYSYTPWLLWFVLSVLLMLCYEAYWIKYFHSDKTMYDFYSKFLFVPAPGAVFPVLAFFCLAIYVKSPLLFASVLILAIGHIGIHLQHLKEIKKASK